MKQELTNVLDKPAESATRDELVAALQEAGRQYIGLAEELISTRRERERLRCDLDKLEKSNRRAKNYSRDMLRKVSDGLDIEAEGLRQVIAAYERFVEFCQTVPAPDDLLDRIADLEVEVAARKTRKPKGRAIRQEDAE
jgi:hypothetical protein